MRKRDRFVVTASAVIIALGACQQAGGTIAASEALADQYGSDNVDVMLRKNGQTVVEVTITDPSFAGLERAELDRRAREAGAIVAQHVELTGEDDAISITLVSGDEEGIVETSRTTMFRYAPSDFETSASETRDSEP